MIIRKPIVAIALGLGLGLAACDGTEPNPEDELVAEGCEHMQEGPSTAVTAGIDLDAAPDVSESHRRFDVGLIDIEGGMGGSVKIGAEDLDYAVFLSLDVPLAFYDGSGAQLETDHVDTEVSACEEVAVAHHLHAPVGTVELRFGPTEDAGVSVVIEGHDDTAHDDG